MKKAKRNPRQQQMVDVLYNLDARLSHLEETLGDEGLKNSAAFNREASTPLVDLCDYEAGSSWEEIHRRAVRETGGDHGIGELLTEEELRECSVELRELNREYLQLHELDAADVAISAAGAIIGALVDIFLVGVPERTPEGVNEGPLGNHVRKHFETMFDPAELEKLERAKVTYDAPYNKGFTTEHVEGLNAYMHRLYSLGHDPILGLFVGVYDVMNGKMTTIDKVGNVVSQVMSSHGYQDRVEPQVFEALAKVILHFKSDVNTAMGLPVPLMGLFNLCQFGNITDENLSVAEIVQGMYYDNFDFIHFCSQSISVMAAEVTVRILYALKRVSEGCSVKDSIPLSTNHDRNPKLATMLFIAHSGAAAINAGKVCFAYKQVSTTGRNPFVAINYPQWIAFAVSSFEQAKWVFLDKPTKQHEYVMNHLFEQMAMSAASTDGSSVVLSAGEA